MTIEPTDIPGVFKCFYWVNLRPGEESCDCRSGQLSDRECHHLRSAKEYAQGQPVTFWREGR